MTEVDDYIAGQPEALQPMLRQVRATLLAAIPGAEEKVRYGMPAVLLGGGPYAVHYAAWKKHLGIYPVPVADDALEAEIAPFRTKKDSLNFVYGQPIPYELIGRIATWLGERSTSSSS